MTGRLLRDDTAVALERLEYGSLDDDVRWDRWVVRLDDGSRLRFHDPRRFGRIWLEPELAVLGPDVLSVTRRQLAGGAAGSAGAGEGGAARPGRGGRSRQHARRRGAVVGGHRPAPAGRDAVVRRGRRAAVRAIRRRLADDAAPRRQPHRHAVADAPRCRFGRCARATAASCAGTSSADARRSGAPPTSAEPGMIRADVSGAPPLLGSTGSTTIVLASLLVVVGIAMICIAVWLVRATRTDSRSLGPLEVMGDRGVAPARRRRPVPHARCRRRPDGAPPPAPILARDPDDPPPLTTLPAELAADCRDGGRGRGRGGRDDTGRRRHGGRRHGGRRPDRARPGRRRHRRTDDATEDVARVDEPQPAEHS